LAVAQGPGRLASHSKPSPAALTLR
jgi:hypothetical protein